MEKTKILLFVMLFVLCSPLAFAEWETYGNNMYNEMTSRIVGSSTQLNLTKSYTTGQSATTQPLIVNFGDPFTEYAVVMSSGGAISLINLVSHNVVNSYSTGLTPLGQLVHHNGLFYGLFYDGAGVYFAEFNIDLTSLTQTGSLLVQNGIAESGNSGMKCIDFSCVFQYNQSFYEVDTGLLEIIYNHIVNESGIILRAKNDYSNVPAIVQISGDYIAYFTEYAVDFYNNNGFLCAYDITNHMPYNVAGFGADGCKKIGHTLQYDRISPHITTPMIMDFSGFKYVAIATNERIYDYGLSIYNCLNLYELNGFDSNHYCITVAHTSGATMDYEISQPFYAKCKFGGIISEGVGVFGGTTNPPYYPDPNNNISFYFTDDSFVTHNIPVGYRRLGREQLSATADMNGDGIYEIIASLDANSSEIKTSIFSCNEGLININNLTSDNQYYSVVISDFNGNGELDVLLQRTGMLKEFGNIGTSLVEICGNGICGAGETYSNCPADCHCGNGICGAGETYSNCPADCPYTVDEGNYSQLNLPTQLVDVNSPNPLDPTQTSGLLPELYLGIMSFFKGAFIPFFLIMIFVMLVFLVFAFGRKLITKIG